MADNRLASLMKFIILVLNLLM